MLSVYTNISYKKMLSITGLESMRTRFTILEEKFRARYERLQEGSDSFLVKVIRWKSSVLNQFTKYEFNVAKEESLELEGLFYLWNLTRMNEPDQEINKFFQNSEHFQQLSFN